MNIGSAVRSQPFDALQNEVASTAPGGAATLATMATSPMKASAMAIHTPEPRTANRSRIRTSVSVRRSIALTPSRR